MNLYLLLNPATNPLTLATATILLALFSGAGTLLLGFEIRGRVMRPTGQGLATLPTPEIKPGAALFKELWVRYRTWLLIALLFSGAALGGALPLVLLVGLLGWQSGREYSRLTSLSGRAFWSLVLMGWLCLAALIAFGPAALPAVPALAFLAWSLLGLLPRLNSQSPNLPGQFYSLLAGYWGFLYLGWLPAHLVALELARGPGVVLLAGLGVALSDIGAFCTGKLLKGPKLAPRLSPNKTWGGVVGNFGGAALALVLLAYALPGMSPPRFLALTGLIGAGSIWGDLLESFIKRQVGVKDAGTILPGFGGLLDRLDSLLLVAPLLFYFVTFTNF